MHRSEIPGILVLPAEQGRNAQLGARCPKAGGRSCSWARQHVQAPGSSQQNSPSIFQYKQDEKVTNILCFKTFFFFPKKDKSLGKSNPGVYFFSSGGVGCSLNTPVAQILLVWFISINLTLTSFILCG